MAPIHDACIRGDIQEVQRLLDDTDDPKALLSSTNDSGYNAYALAFVNQRYELVRHISKGKPWFEIFMLFQDVIKLQKLDCSMHDIIENGYIETFDEESICYGIMSLLDEGKDVNSRNSSLDTPLHLACRYKMKLVVNFLLDKGADVQALSRTLKHPIHELCDITGDEDIDSTSFEDILTTLINYGAKLDGLDSHQRTPIDILYEKPNCGETIKKAFANVMVKTVIDLKQSLETTRKENSLTPQVQSLLIHTSIAIKQLEKLKQT